MSGPVLVGAENSNARNWKIAGVGMLDEVRAGLTSVVSRLELYNYRRWSINFTILDPNIDGWWMDLEPEDLEPTG